MIKLIAIFSLSYLIGCKDTQEIYEHNGGDNYYNSPSDSLNLEGFYLLPENGSLELVKLENGSYTIYGTQRVISENVDNSLSLHPAFSTTAVLPINNELNILGNVTYSVTHNVKKDSDNSSITGSRLTNVNFKINNEGKLKITIRIYATNNTNVDSERVVTEE